MPGLIESNGHVVFSGQSDHATYFAERWQEYYEIGARNLYTGLLQGLTTIRDTMDPLEEMLRLRADIASGKIAGPRLFTSGTILNYPGAYREETPQIRALDPADLERATAALELDIRNGLHGREVVRDYAAKGVDFIKVSAYSGPENNPPVLSTKDLRVIVDEAHDRGLSVTTHTMSVASVRAVLDAGVDAMEHPELVAKEEIPLGELPDDLVRRIAQEEVYSIPLLMAIEVYVRYMNRPELLDDPAEVRNAPADLVQEAREWIAEELAANPDAVREWEEMYELGRRNLRKLIQARAPIALGTDKGTRLNFHESANHVQELELYVELGMTPMEAIVSATRRGAELLGVQKELGTVEAGKLADVIVVDGNPLEEIGALRRVTMVFKGGVRYN